MAKPKILKLFKNGSAMLAGEKFRYAGCRMEGEVFIHSLYSQEDDKYFEWREVEEVGGGKISTYRVQPVIPLGESDESQELG